MKLLPRARLKYDRVGAAWMLLYPEGGLVLNQTAYEIAQLCQRSIARPELFRVLCERYPKTPKEAIERDTEQLLSWLERHALLERDSDEER